MGRFMIRVMSAKAKLSEALFYRDRLWLGGGQCGQCNFSKWETPYN